MATVGGAARHAEAAREDLVAGGLRDQVGFAGQQRLVDFYLPVAYHLAVDHDLVTRPKNQQIVEHDLGRVDGVLADPRGSRWLLGRVSRAIRSSVRLARPSCTTPTTTFSRTSPAVTSALSMLPMISSTTPMPKSTVLIKVKAFSRHDLRVGTAGAKAHTVDLSGLSARLDLGKR